MTALRDATDSQMAMLADLVASLEAAEATLSSMQAARDGMLAMAGRLAVDIARESAHPDHGDMAIRTVAAEIGAAQRVSDRTIERRMAEASWLVERFPAVWAAQGEGRISGAHSRVIVEAGAHLDDAVDRQAYAAEAVTLAESESPNRLRRLARRLAERFQERTIAERHRDAREKRRVWVKDLDDGMAELGARGPAALVHGMFDRLSQMAHAVKEENARAANAAASGTDIDTDIAGEHSVGEEYVADERSVDQLRADLLADLVLTGAPTGHDTTEGLLGAIHARIEVSVPVMTLMQDDQAGPEANDLDLTGLGVGGGLDVGNGLGVGDGLDHRLDGVDPRLTDRDLPPAELDGTTPIDARTARALAGSATGWDRVFTHPISGAMLAVDRYRPSEHLRRHLRARDQRCRFPGCGIRARKCDLDHNHAAASGGPTSDTNLSAFCRRHHMLKHNSPWHVEQRAGGVLEWTSPTGRGYIDRPPTQNTVVFTDTSAPSPF
ncbi:MULTISPECIES: HNH endonuclease signature motif containing protein [unclassified Microbacterium]|uniref:HNH endonuclease signature motif containing protein n=1 Tax=unclassified Microbacterium TaxID=2609290 RepID=UPI000CFADE3C|nr:MULTISPECIES: HNH endonuclease signature motif containing protein [unclassified Microbacterium]PQZ57485.1 HNH endonuclease [Microbacterium sp. MYb43]PQZ77305.1 HNH endonuclease [Microbacterium sp. MYb40]PRB22718.1 HNH endonuclease [Microbacterium sp. MYb54]PRB28940.1 HNH endonuclease [Microbacterium sp. MYb50]PRB68984.1 HNH endonuclease [Microbacterium sp. MYb24]